MKSPTTNNPAPTVSSGMSAQQMALLQRSQQQHQQQQNPAFAPMGAYNLNQQQMMFGSPMMSNQQMPLNQPMRIGQAPIGQNPNPALSQTMPTMVMQQQQPPLSLPMRVAQNPPMGGNPALSQTMPTMAMQQPAFGQPQMMPMMAQPMTTSAGRPLSMGNVSLAQTVTIGAPVGQQAPMMMMPQQAAAGQQTKIGQQNPTGGQNSALSQTMPAMAMQQTPLGQQVPMMPMMAQPMTLRQQTTAGRPVSMYNMSLSQTMPAMSVGQQSPMGLQVPMMPMSSSGMTSSGTLVVGQQTPIGQQAKQQQRFSAQMMPIGQPLMFNSSSPLSSGGSSPSSPKQLIMSQGAMPYGNPGLASPMMVVNSQKQPAMTGSMRMSAGMTMSLSPSSRAAAGKQFDLRIDDGSSSPSLTRSAINLGEGSKTSHHALPANSVWARQLSHMQTQNNDQYAVVRTATGQTKCMALRRVYGSVKKDGSGSKGDELVPPPANPDNPKDLKAWDEAWEKAIVELPEEPVLSMLVVHLRKCMTFNLHSLGEPLTKITAEYTSKASLIQVKNDDNVCDKMTEVVEQYVAAVTPRLVRHYPLLKDKEQWIQDGLFELMFQELHNVIFAIYLNRHSEQDAALLSLFRDFSYITPAHLGLKKMFWLTEEKTIDIATPLESTPYGEAIQALRQLDSMNSYLSKIQCLVEAGKSINTCVEKYWEKRPDKPAGLGLAADEFLPLFCYIIIKSQVSDMYSTLRLIEDFKIEADDKGEGGYYIATFQSAIKIIQSLKESDFNKFFADAWGIPVEQSQPSGVNFAGSMVAGGIMHQNPVLASTPIKGLSLTAPVMSNHP